MSNAISNSAYTNQTTAVQAQPAAKAAAPSPKPAPAKAPAPSPAVNDTVQISNAARAMMQEAIETPVQTAKEAAKGDRQAQRLLAKEAAAKAE